MDAIHKVASPSENITQSDSYVENEQDNINAHARSLEDSEPSPQVVIGSAEGSAFQRVQPLVQTEADADASESSQNPASVEEDQESSDVASPGDVASPPGDRSGMKPLFEQVNDVKDVASNVVKNLNILRDAVQQKMSSLQSRM